MLAVGAPKGHAGVCEEWPEQLILGFREFTRHVVDQFAGRRIADGRLCWHDANVLTGTHAPLGIHIALARLRAEGDALRQALRHLAAQEAYLALGNA